MFFANASRKTRKTRRPAGKKRSGAKGVRTAVSKSGNRWHKTASGQWVKEGGKGGGRSSKRRSSPKRKAAPKKRYGTRKTTSRRTKRGYGRKPAAKRRASKASGCGAVHADLVQLHKALGSLLRRV